MSSILEQTTTDQSKAREIRKAMQEKKDVLCSLLVRHSAVFHADAIIRDVVISWS